MWFLWKITTNHKVIGRVRTFDPNNREGYARIYFNTLFGNDFSREQDNDINAALIMVILLLLSMFAREIVLSGCMTQLGLKHESV